MAKSVLVIESDDQGQFFLWVAGGTMTLGDAPGRAEVLLRDLHVTRVRCEVEIDEDTVVVSRPPSAAGQPGAQRELHPGQALRLAHARMHLETLPDDSPEEATEVMAAMAPGDAAAPPAAEGTFKRLRVIDGADLGRAFRLPETGSTSVGKSAKHADVVLHDLYVSRVHCVLEVEGGRVLVRHSEGDNGTLINGKRITERQELHLGDVLRVGNSHLRLETALTLDSPAESEQEEEEGELTTKEDRAEETEAGSAEDAGPPHEFVGRVFGNYRVVQLLGRGHSGEVFRARDVRNNLAVALKVLSTDFPADGQELQKFVQALKVATQQHHPNLVTILTAGRSGPHCWIAREYVEGESVAVTAGRLAQRGKINWTRACRVAVHLARALSFLHQQRIVHGNVTPANVLLGADKTTRLADLMLDKALEGSRLQDATLEKKLLAELPYLAPEQTDPKAFVDDLADLYGLGAVAYVLLTGRPPFSGDSPAEIIEQIRQTPVVRPTTYQRGIPAAFEAVVLKLTSKHQEDRYQTAAELLAAVEAIAEEHQVEV
jgi:Protein kinase domain/Inner membrane component of T3SS, cytoplasmic domain